MKPIKQDNREIKINFPTIEVKYDHTKEFQCNKCGFVCMDTPENRKFHSTKKHEVRVSEDYIGNGDYTSVLIASTEFYKHNL